MTTLQSEPLVKYIVFLLVNNLSPPDKVQSFVNDFLNFSLYIIIHIKLNYVIFILVHYPD